MTGQTTRDAQQLSYRVVAEASLEANLWRLQRLQHLDAATQLGTARGRGEGGGPHLLHYPLPLLTAPLLSGCRLAEEAELIARVGAIVAIPAVEAGTHTRWQASTVSRAAVGT